jgi:hypothetical protein
MGSTCEPSRPKETAEGLDFFLNLKLNYLTADGPPIAINPMAPVNH